MTTLRDTGHYVLMASTAGAEATLDAAAFYRRRLRLTGMNMTVNSGTDLRDILDELTPGFETGALRAPATQAWPLAEATRAFEAVATGTDGVKQVLLPAELGQGATPGHLESLSTAARHH
jgi:NADPH:quinone reductase-like Zn-dependent oxidoreductase